MSAGNPLVEQVLAGENRELQLLAAQGVLPLGLDDLVPLQVHLAEHGSAEIAQCARQSLEALDGRVAAPLLAAGAPPAVLEWFARYHPDPQLVETVLRRRDVSRELLIEIAGRLTPDLQEALLLRQDTIVERPEILVALEANPQLSAFARRRIAEYRQHLLPQATTAAEELPAVVELGEVGDLTGDEIAEIERVRASAPAKGEVDERTGLSESQVRSLPVPIRIKLTKGASRTLRSILIRDSNRLVALSVLASAALSEDEIEQIAANRSMDEEVLAALARRREWVSHYGVCKNLVLNARTPVGISVRLVSRLSVRDLKVLRKDRNVPEPVRSTAERLYRIKSV